MPIERDPNYVAQANAQRAQARTALRKRIDATIDPMESMARTDAMQGSTVSAGLGSGGEEFDFGGNQLINFGGGGSPVRSGLRRLSGGYAGPATVAGGCPGGQCGVPQRSTPAMQSSPVVASAPMASTVVPSSAPAYSGAADPEVAYQMQLAGDPSSYAAYLNARAMGDAQTAEGTRMARQERIDAEKAALNKFQMQEISEDNKYVRKNMEANTRLTEAEAEEQEAVLVSTGERALQDTVDGKMSPESAVAAVARVRAETMSLPYVKGGNRDVPEQVAATIAKESEQYARRVVYGMAFVSDIAKDAARATPGADGSVSTDKAVMDSIHRLGTSYWRGGLFQKGWEVVDEALRNDVTFVLEQEMPELYAERAEAEARAKGLDADATAQSVAAARQSGATAAAMLDDAVRSNILDWYNRNRAGTMNWSDPWGTGQEQPAAAAQPAGTPAGRWHGYKGSDAVEPVSPFSFDPVDANQTLPDIPPQYRRQVAARTV